MAGEENATGQKPKDPRPSAAQLRKHADELAALRKRADDGDPKVDHRRLWELHYLADGQTPPTTDGEA